MANRTTLLTAATLKSWLFCQPISPRMVSQLIILARAQRLFITQMVTFLIKKAAQTASHELLTCDAEHRDTELNNWATYSEVAFSFHADGSAKMAQLFEMAGAKE